MRLSSDTVIGAVLILFCGLMYLATLEVPEPQFGSMGAAFFPTILIALLAPMSLALLLRGLWADRRARRPEGEPAAPRTLRGWLSRHQNAVFSFAVFFLFVLLLEPLGYMLSGFLYLLAMQGFLGPRSRGKLPLHLSVSAGITLFVWIVFRWVLVVLLPEGELF